MANSSSTLSTASILLWWNRLADKPGGRWLFSFMLGRLAPYSGSICPNIVEIKPGFTRVMLRDRKKVRNHLNSIHAIALINLGEIATGLALLSAISADMRGILVDIKAEYLKKARGTLTATATFELPDQLDDQTSCPVIAELRDQSGDLVTIVTASWLVGYRPK